MSDSEEFGNRQPTVALIGTLDTKGSEYQWVSEQLRHAGVSVLVVDVGTGSADGFTSTIHISNDDVAQAAGTSLAALRAQGDRGQATTFLGDGAAQVLAELVVSQRIHGVLALGGSSGTSMAARAVRDLPIGLPKFLVSTMASGDVSPYVGNSDVTLMYSVVDIAGINQISRTVLGNAVAGIAGMAKARHAGDSGATNKDDRPLVGASMFGVTTPAVDAARVRLEELGYEVLVFHATGSGGRALEALIRSGMLAGVLDLTTTELADDLVGGVLSAGPSRVTAAGETQTPQVVSLGALDMVNFGPRESVPAVFEQRQFVVHNPTVTLMRTTAEENTQLGRSLGEKLSLSPQTTVLLIPHGGISALDSPGQPFFDKYASGALFAAVEAAVGASGAKVINDPRHLNDPEFAHLAAEELHALIVGRS